MKRAHSSPSPDPLPTKHPCQSFSLHRDSLNLIWVSKRSSVFHRLPPGLLQVITQLLSPLPIPVIQNESLYLLDVGGRRCKELPLAARLATTETVCFLDDDSVIFINFTDISLDFYRMYLSDSETDLLLRARSPRCNAATVFYERSVYVFGGFHRVTNMPIVDCFQADPLLLCGYAVPDLPHIPSFSYSAVYVPFPHLGAIDVYSPLMNEFADSPIVTAKFPGESVAYVSGGELVVVMGSGWVMKAGLGPGGGAGFFIIEEAKARTLLGRQVWVVGCKVYWVKTHNDVVEADVELRNLGDIGRMVMWK